MFDLLFCEVAAGDGPAADVVGVAAEPSLLFVSGSNLTSGAGAIDDMVVVTKSQ